VHLLPYIVLARLHRAAIDARRKARTWRYIAWSAVAGIATGLMIAIALSFILMFWAIGLEWLAALLGIGLIIPAIAGPVARGVCVPAGWVRPAYYTGLVSRPGPDAPAYALCLAAWAWMHRPSGTGERWIAARRDARVPLGDGEVVVTALLMAGRGDHDGARALLRSVRLLVEDHPSVREIAGEWLAVDAAERGAWLSLHDDAINARWPATPLTYFLEGVAARRVGGLGAPGGVELRARWLLAPHRRATRELLAMTPAATPVPTESTAAAGEGPAPLPRAVAAHLVFGAHPPSASGLASTVRAWDHALADSDTHGWLSRRALELDAPLGAVDRALREVAGAVADELARAAETARLGAPAATGAVGSELARRLRHGRLDALEAGFTRWAQRRHDGEVHPAIDEWREFIALQAAYANAVEAGGTELRRLAFPHAFSTGSNMAAWLWNSRSEYALSHAVSKWLLDEALAVGDTEAIELGHRNCGMSIPTRLGRIYGDS
jgi:hypothetical protein